MSVFLRSLGWLQNTVERLVGRKPDLGAIRALVERSAPLPDGDGPYVLFVMPRYWPLHLAWAAVIAYAARHRGARVRFLLCRRGMPTCETIRLETRYRRGLICEACSVGAAGLVDAFGFETLDMTALVPAERRARIAEDAAARETLDAMLGADVAGLEARALLFPSLIRQLRRVTLLDDEETRDLAREYLVAARVAAEAFEAAIAAERPDRVVVFSGRIAAEATTLALAKRHGIEALCVEHGIRVDTLILARDQAATDLPTDVLWEQVKDEALTPAERERLDRYLLVRRRGEDSIIQYWPEVEDDARRIAAELGLDGRPLTVLFTNVIWDTAVTGRDLAFESMPAWIDATIRAFAAMPDRQLVIRVHPAEVRLERFRTVETVGSRLAVDWPELPENVRVVPPESPLSSYRLMEAAGLGLVYTSTVGMEMAALGKPVVAAARAHYWGKGFTLDPADEAAYLALLRGPVAAPPDAVELVRRYMNLYYFRFNVAFEPVHQPLEDRFELRFERLDDLAPGRYPGLDVVADALLGGGPLMGPRELAPER